MSATPIPESGPKRLAVLEPALVRGIIGALVSIALVWGFDFTELGDQIIATADGLGIIVALTTPLWIRQGVTPDAKVVTAKEDSYLVAGPAHTEPTGRTIGHVADLDVDLEN